MGTLLGLFVSSLVAGAGATTGVVIGLTAAPATVASTVFVAETPAAFYVGTSFFLRKVWGIARVPFKKRAEVRAQQAV